MSVNDEQSEEQPQRRRGGFGFGWLIFLLIAFGQPLFRWLQSWWSSLSVGGGFAVSADFIPWLIGGAMAIFVVVAVLRAISGGGNASPGPMTAPSGPLPSSGSRPTIPGPRPFPAAEPTQSRGLPAPPRLGGPPKFDPIIDPWVLAVGVVGLIALVIFWLVFVDPGLLAW